MKLSTFFLALIPFALIGCTEILRTGTITGRVTDEDGLPVRDARVYTTDGETRTSANGAYTLVGNRDDFISVFAEYSANGVSFRGRNVARSVNGEIQNSVNISIARTSQLAHIRGQVRDLDGFPLAGVSVFAFMGANLSSVRAVTDTSGNYEMRDLLSGVQYELNAGAQGLSADEAVLTLSAGQTRTVNFVVGNAGFPSLPVPANLSALVWTSPSVTRSVQDSQAYENVKRLYDPSRASRLSSRSSGFGNPIEVELNWDRLSGPDFYGYGIYRGTGNGSITDYDFYREPLAGTYIDTDPSLFADQRYRYQITSLGTRFPDDPDSESARSGVVEAIPLDDLFANEASFSPNLRFSWLSGSGATSYVVYLFDEFPGLGVNSIWNNAGSPTTQLSLNYSGPTLTNGNRYYFLVLGLANGNDSRTISEIKQFIQ